MNETGVCNCPSTGDSDRMPGVAIDPEELSCFRCGICCNVYQVRINRAEATLIAHSMGIDYWEWVGRYCDARWPDPRSHLIRHDDKGCVFLQDAGPDGALCGIYAVRPYSCRAWGAGVFKPACQEGLRRFWQVEVNAAGQLEGSSESLARLRRFLAEP